MTFARDHERDAEQLIRDADTAMYRAKLAGRGRVAVSGSEAIASGPVGD